MCFSLKGLKKISSIPITCTFHGLDVVFANKIYQRLLVSRMKKLDKIVAVSRATADECRIRGASEENIAIIPNGVDKDMRKIRKDPLFKERLEQKIGLSLEEKKVLLSVGRPVRRKGVSWFMENVMPYLKQDVIYIVVGASLKKDSLFRAILKLLPKKWAGQLECIYGIGLEREKQHKLIKTKNLKDRVFILGKVPYHELLQLYRHSHLFIMPNIPVYGDMEGFGLTALEASANRAVVVASRLEGIRDSVKEGKNGCLVEPSEPKAWIKKINDLLAEPSKLKKTAESFQLYTLQNYSWERMTEAYRRLFSLLLHSKQKPQQSVSPVK